MEEHKRESARRSKDERRTIHRRVAHRRKNNLPAETENRTSLDQRSDYQRKGNRRLEE